MRRLDHIKKLSDEGGRGWLVDVRCNKCGRTGWLKPQVLAQKAGREATLESLRERLRCTQCGKKDLDVGAVSEPRPRGLTKYPR